MLIARKLRAENRAEYLLYMWQLEDLLRANDCDIDRLRAGYLSRFELDDATRAETEQWYAELCDMMRTEGLREKGHLQICRNTLQSLAELHEQLLHSERFPYYRSMYYKALPHIVALRAKQGTPDAPELQTCFEALYGVLLLRLQQREVSADTAQAVQDISTLLGQLADYFNKNQEKPLDFE